MPTNFVDIDMDEMEYVDGGGAISNWFFSTKTVGAALNTAIGYAIPVASVASYIRSAGKQVAQKFLMGVVQRKLKEIGLVVLAGFVGPAVTFAMNYLDVGNAIANWLDSRDSSPNNQIVWFG